jgi:predicted N-acyltransferase
MGFDIQVFNSVVEVGQAAWDKLGGGQPFTSYRWYRFGEAVMADCIPVYITLSEHGEAVARASFWVIRNEPLPITWPLVRSTIQAVLRYRPLLICRSPLANASGLILPESPLRHSALEALIGVAKEEARKYKVSFLLFDYLEEEQIHWSDWPKEFSSVAVPDPGTRMEIIWSNFDQYLAHLSPKVRKHYRQYNREAEDLGIKITRHDDITNIEPALALIRSVEKHHHSSPNPWARSLLENANRAGAIWLTARLNDRLVGCELILEDNGTQMVTSLGMAKDVPHIYFLLGYADIRYAIEKKKRFLRWGSGAYDAKRRMGFELEHDNNVIFYGNGIIPGLVARIAAS